jgi:hypothetical protein
MTNVSNFGMRPARHGSHVERPAPGDAAASARVSRTPNGFRSLAGRTRWPAVGALPAAGDRSPRLRNPAASRAPAIGQSTTTVVREADLIEVAAISLPEQLLPIMKGLSLGKPDVTVSRLLGMSPRTFSRRVAELLAYLEVETRFQGGMEVALRWMLSDDPQIH